MRAGLLMRFPESRSTEEERRAGRESSKRWAEERNSVQETGSQLERWERTLPRVECYGSQGRRGCCRNEIRFEKNLLGRAKWKSS